MAQRVGVVVLVGFFGVLVAGVQRVACSVQVGSTTVTVNVYFFAGMVSV